MKTYAEMAEIFHRASKEAADIDMRFMWLVYAHAFNERAKLEAVAEARKDHSSIPYHTLGYFKRYSQSAQNGSIDGLRR